MLDIFSGIYILIFSLLSIGSANEQLLQISPPKLTEQTTASLSFEWETNIASEGFYRFARYPDQIRVDAEMFSCGLESNISHRASIDNLESGGFYYFQSINVLGGDTLYSEVQLQSLVSNSTGEIEIYFNNDIMPSVSRGANPDGVTTAEMESAIISKIDNAQATIDYCMFNTHRESIVESLREAVGRGVQVRVIFNERLETTNVAIGGTEPFETLERLGDGFMHNKFLIIDAELENESWVMSGSTNFTNEQMDIDPNHVIFIQDKSLAQAYEIEFEEMWGSDGPTPDRSNAKFGVEKSDNTPHEFMIDGKKVELYFSPSDLVSEKINNAILQAESTVDAALLIFTKWETRDALEDELDEGTKFRAIIEDQESSEDIISRLERSGAEILEHPPESQLHHKYAIIDEALQDERSKVILGSHNWTHSADTRHDENLLIIHDAEIANLFQQEFEARWAELTSAVVDLDKAEVLAIYPNPSSEYVTVSVIKSVSWIKIIDIRGSLVQYVNVEKNQREQIVDISHLEGGSYIVVGGDNEKAIGVGSFIKS